MFKPDLNSEFASQTGQRIKKKLDCKASNWPDERNSTWVVFVLCSRLFIPWCTEILHNEKKYIPGQLSLFHIFSTNATPIKEKPKGPQSRQKWCFVTRHKSSFKFVFTARERSIIFHVHQGGSGNGLRCRLFFFMDYKSKTKNPKETFLPRTGRVE